MKPPYEINAKILKLCTSIAEFLGQYQGAHSPRPQPQLRRGNRIKTIQSSLAMEGNTLSLDQVTDIVDNKRVLGSAQEILEVKNAIRAYDQISSYNCLSLSSFMKAHKNLTQEILEDAGKCRSKNVRIFKGSKVSHVAPQPRMLPQLMDNLFEYLKKDKETHPLIKSCVFHYELEFIHPFTDGNGRAGRLWQTVFLYSYHPIFEYLPLESVIKKRQKAYYKALENANQTGRSTEFIEFMLGVIYEALDSYLTAIRPEPRTKTNRLHDAKEQFSANPFSRKNYLQLHKTISTATASRDLAFGVKIGLLKKEGDRVLTRYCFIDQ